MSKVNQYVTLIAALPPHNPELFETKQPSISRLQLEDRLSMLTQEDAGQLSMIEDLLHWERLPISTTDEVLLPRIRQVLDQLEEPLLKEIVEWRLDLRTILAALRLRRRGRSAPPAEWGYGRWTRRIEAHWNEPGMGLESLHPWVIDADQMLRQNDHYKLERMLLSQVWRYYQRIADDHYFDFEAVVIYVLRWSITARWSRYNVKAAEQRFDHLIEIALGEYRNIFA